MTVKLTPTQDLILEVLAARHRLGEPHWPFDYRLRPALRALEAAGLISYENAVTGHLRARLTPTGRKEAYGTGDYESPLEAQIRALAHPWQGTGSDCRHRDYFGSYCPHGRTHPIHREATP